MPRRCQRVAAAVRRYLGDFGGKRDASDAGQRGHKLAIVWCSTVACSPRKSKTRCLHAAGWMAQTIADLVDQEEGRSAWLRDGVGDFSHLQMRG